MGHLGFSCVYQLADVVLLLLNLHYPLIWLTRARADEKKNLLAVGTRKATAPPS